MFSVWLQSRCTKYLKYLLVSYFLTNPERVPRMSLHPNNCVKCLHERMIAGRIQDYSR